MKRKNMELAVGASIFIALFILIAGVMWLKEVNVARRLVEYTTLFHNVGILQPGDPVHVNGIKRGTIKKMYLRKPMVAVVISLDRGIQLTDSCTVTVQNIGLMGERMIGIQLSGKGAPYRHNTRSDTTFITGHFDSGIAEAMGMIGRVLEDVESIIGVAREIIDQTVGDTGFVDFFNNLVARLDTITYAVEHLVVDNKPGLQKAITDLESVASDVRGLLDANSGHISKILENGSDLTEEALVIAGNLDSIAVTVKQMIADIESGQGTIGMLIEDEQFYNDLKTSLSNIDTLVEDINRNGLKLRVKLGFGNRDNRSR